MRNTAQTAPEAALPALRVVSVIPVEAPGMAAYFDVRIGRGDDGLTIRQWRLLRTGAPGDPQYWISPPQQTTVNRDGKRQYHTLLQIPPAWRPAILARALAAYQKATAAGSEAAR